MLSKGELTLNGQAVKFWVKHFEQPSEFGIDAGRISKLFIEINGILTCSYDRGWDVKPEDELAKEVLATLIAKYN